MSGVWASASASCSFSKPLLLLHPFSSTSTPSCLKLKGSTFATTTPLRCNNSIWPRGPTSGEGDSRSILDAFFLGKALVEAVNERIESTVGEFLSTVGRLQAEQRKQVQDFQGDVLERAKKAKEKAAREAMETQGLISKSSADTEAADYATSRSSYSVTETVASVQPTPPYEINNDPEEDERPALNPSTDD